MAAKRKKEALKQYYRKRTVESKIYLKKQRAILRKITKKSRRTHWVNYISEINERTPTNIIWDKIRAISGKKCCGKNVPNILTYQGKEVYVKEQMAQVFAKNLERTSSSKNYTREFLKMKRKVEAEPIIIESSNNEQYNGELTIKELREALHKCNSNSEGPDGIYYCMIKNLIEVTQKELLNLYNRIWTEQKYPTSWKEAVVIHIGKPNKDLSNPDNYRPIALTSCLSKIMERIINNRLSWWLEKFNCLSDF